MSIIPVLLDSRPAFSGAEVGSGSLLLLPAGRDLVLREMMRSVLKVTAQRPIVLSSFEPDEAYRKRIVEGFSDVDRITMVRNFGNEIQRFTPSDVFLFVSAICYPVDGIDLRPLCATAVNDARMVRHLVAFEAPTLRTKELVQTDDEGRVRKIQRYFEPVTWPFPSGVMASLVPVACAQIALPLTLASLEGLRMQLASSGVPSQDVPFHGDCFDLDDEAGALALSERRVSALATMREISRNRGASKSEPLVSLKATISPTARLVGPVMVRDGASIGEGALVIGPATIGEGARVGAGAIVAQSLLLPDSAVAPGATVRHRVVSGDAVSTVAVAGQRRHAAPHRVADPDVPRRAIPTYVTIKALFEPILAVAALLVLSPVMALLAVIVKLTSTGPIFYGDSREGKDARAFKCWKFRSMLTNADDLQRALAAQQKMDGPQFKMANDPRVTKIGSILRKLNVDELPQLWNVVKGEMSFVGPRPSPFRENQICVPWRNGRLSVRPGITGLWQVCRKDRETGDFHQWIHYDLLYVRNVSFLLDVKILAATILTLGGRKPVPLSYMIRRRPRARRLTAMTMPRYRVRTESVPTTALQ